MLLPVIVNWLTIISSQDAFQWQIKFFWEMGGGGGQMKFFACHMTHVSAIQNEAAYT